MCMSTMLPISSVDILNTTPCETYRIKRVGQSTSNLDYVHFTGIKQRVWDPIHHTDVRGLAAVSVLPMTKSSPTQMHSERSKPNYIAVNRTSYVIN